MTDREQTTLTEIRNRWRRTPRRDGFREEIPPHFRSRILFGLVLAFAIGVVFTTETVIAAADMANKGKPAWPGAVLLTVLGIVICWFVSWLLTNGGEE